MSNLLDNLPTPQSIAAMIVQAIESGQSDEELLKLMAHWAWSMGSKAPLVHMTPHGRLLYLLALMQAGPRP